MVKGGSYDRDLLCLSLANDKLVEALANFLGRWKLHHGLLLFITAIRFLLILFASETLNFPISRMTNFIISINIIVVITFPCPFDLTEFDKAPLKRRELEGPEIESRLALWTEINGLIDPRFSCGEGQGAVGEDDEHLSGAARAVDVSPDVVVIVSSAAGVPNTAGERGGEEEEGD